MALENRSEQGQRAPSNIVLRAVYGVGRLPGRSVRIEKFQNRKPDKAVEIVYLGQRAAAFFRGNLEMERCIGECTQHVFTKAYGGRRGDDGKPTVSLQSDLMAAAEIEVQLFWSLGRGDVWHMVKMYPVRHLERFTEERSDVSYGAILPLESDPYQTELFHYFRLVGRLKADRSKETVRMRQRHEHWEFGDYDYDVADRRWFYPDGETLSEVVLYDNPYGPFSNYHF